VLRGPGWSRVYEGNVRSTVFRADRSHRRMHRREAFSAAEVRSRSAQVIPHFVRGHISRTW
jgi:hypothetical protein